MYKNIFKNVMCVCMRVCVYVRTYVCIYVCMRVCVYVCVVCRSTYKPGNVCKFVIQQEINHHGFLPPITIDF